jgi:two-component system, NarL family, sensor histidine kinase UhpB
VNRRRVRRVESVQALDPDGQWNARDADAEKALQQKLVAALEQRVRAETSLRQVETRFRHLLEHASDVVYELDEHGCFLSCNDQAVQHKLGYLATDLIGRSLADLVPPPYRRPVREFNARQLRNPGGTNYFELPLLTKDQHLVWLGQHVSCIIGENQARRLQAVCHEINPQAERLRELERSREQWRDLSTHLQGKIEAERTRIAQDIHDELGAALTAIRMELALPSEPAGAEEPGRRNAVAIARIDAAIEAMRRICTDLRPSLLDNMGLCAAIEWLCQDVQKRAGVRCEVSLGGLPEECDPDKGIALFRIVQEAVTNAIRHANASTLRIRQRSSRDAIVISVSDDGRGIKPRELAGRRSFGLVGMHERAQAFGGTVKISGGRKGTQVTVRMPVP